MERNNHRRFADPAKKSGQPAQHIKHPGRHQKPSEPKADQGSGHDNTQRHDYTPTSSENRGASKPITNQDEQRRATNVNGSGTSEEEIEGDPRTRWTFPCERSRILRSTPR